MKLASALSHLALICSVVGCGHSQDKPKPRKVGDGMAMSSAHSQAEGWEVNDMNRPVPPLVTPGEFSTQAHVGTAPSDAIVLFDGKDLSKWKSDKGAAEWIVHDGIMEIKPHSGSISTKDEFGDCQLHIEWQTPPDVKGEGQLRGNSGVFLQGLYEAQVLDTRTNRTYADGMAGSLYGQYPPIVNAARPAGEWQVYDIVFRPARVDDKGHVTKPARMTVFLNNILVQDDMELIGPSSHHVLVSYPNVMPAKGPITLQDHGDKVFYRNIWLRPIPAEKEKPPVRSNSGK